MTRRTSACWTVGRLSLVACGLLACALLACAFLVVPTGIAQERSPHVHQRVVRLRSPWGERKVAVTWSRAEAGVRRDNNLPTLVALHGKSESVRGPERGFLGWVIDYRLPDAFGALQRGRLTDGDYGGLVRAEHLAHVNAALKARPFGGVFVITPYTPDLLSQPVGSPEIREFGDWVAGDLLSQVRERFSAASKERDSTAIDGVSLGGRLALDVGLAHPQTFGAVGATQPAIVGREAALAELAASIQRPPRIRLLSSEDDPYLDATRKLSALLRERHVAHELGIVPGPHNARFNRGPGGLEMLLYYDREFGSR